MRWMAMTLRPRQHPAACSDTDVFYRRSGGISRTRGHAPAFCLPKPRGVCAATDIIRKCYGYGSICAMAVGSASAILPCVQDDHACLAGLAALWAKAVKQVPKNAEIVRVGVTLCELTPANARQLDLLLNDDTERQKCEVITNTIDGLNRKFGKRVLTLGDWTPPPSNYTGGKIAYNRIPSAEDFW